MGKTLQIKGGTTDKVNDYTGSERELIVDTDKQQLVVQDGKTKGGIRVPSNLSVAVQDSIMSKAQFEALAANRRDEFPGSGIISSKISKHEDGGTRFSYVGDTPITVRRYDIASCCLNSLSIAASENNAYEATSNRYFNIGGYKIDLHIGSGGYDIKLPKQNIITNENNSSSLSKDYKQGDMLILNDVNRKLFSNGEFTDNIDGVKKRYSDDTISHDDGKLKLEFTANSKYSLAFVTVDTIVGVQYEVNVDLISGKGLRIVASTDNTAANSNHYASSYGTGKLIFRATTTKTAIGLGFDYVNQEFNDDGSEINVYDNLVITQHTSQQITCKYDISAKIDMYTTTDSFIGLTAASARHMVILETWHENIANKDFVHQRGSVQDRGDAMSGLPALVEPTFNGFDTYSLLGTWQEPGEIVGKGYVWSNLTDEQKIIFASNPDNNIYKIGEDIYQVKYRVRVIKGFGNDWVTATPHYTHSYAMASQGLRIAVKGAYALNADYYDAANGLPLNRNKYIDANSSYNEYPIKVNGTYGSDDYNDVYKEQAIPLLLVQRKNIGCYHPSLNPDGSARIYYDGAACMHWEVPDTLLTTVADCFNHENIATVDKDDATNASRLSMLDDGSDDPDTYKVTGSMESHVSGTPNGTYYDVVYNNDVEDLRMEANRITDVDKYVHDRVNDAMSNRFRGTEHTYGLIEVAEPHKQSYIWLGSGSPDIGSEIQLYTKEHPTSTYHSNVSHDDYELGEEIDFISGNKFLKMSIESKQGDYQSFRGRILDTNMTLDDFTKYNNYFSFNEKTFVKGKRTFVQSGRITVCDIIGDYRTIAERVSFTTSSGDDQEQVISKNTYVLADGTYYRSKADRGEVAIVIDPDTEDYSDDDKWSDLGTDGTIGGYPKFIRENGYDGVPRLVSGKGTSLLPMDMKRSSNTLNYTELSRKIYSNSNYPRCKKVIAYVDGEPRTLKYTASWNTAGTGDYDIYWTYIGNNGFACGLKDVTEEQLINAVFMVYYEVSADPLEVVDNYVTPALAIGEANLIQGGKYVNQYGTTLLNNLIGKVGTDSSDYANISLGKPFNFYVRSSGEIGNATNNTPEHAVPYLDSSIGHKVKVLPYLNSIHNRAKLNIIFKEMAWSDTGANKVYFDTGYTNNWKNIGGADGEVIIEGPGENGRLYNNAGDNRDKFLEIFLDDVQVSGGIEVHVADYNDADNWSILSDDIVANNTVVYHSGLAMIARIPIVGHIIGRIKVLHNNDEGLYLERVRVISSDATTPKTYTPGSYGDDNKMPIHSKTALFTDLNGKKVLYGQKAIKLRNFID